MNSLTFIRPLNCHYCGESFRWSETSHEANCLENPKNRCRYCGDKFGGDYKNPARDKLKQHIKNGCVVKKRRIQALIEDLRPNVNSYSLSYGTLSDSAYARSDVTRVTSFCPFCGLEFRQTTRDASPVSILHQENCRYNPRNQCQLCGLRFSGWGTGAAQQRLAIHSQHCTMNSQNRDRCQFCGLTFQTLYAGPTARQLVEKHKRQCRGNPRNRCPYCDIIFSGPVQLQQHFHTCSRKQEADCVWLRYNGLSCREAAVYSTAVPFFFTPPAEYNPSYNGSFGSIGSFYPWTSSMPQDLGIYDRLHDNETQAEIAGIAAKLAFYHGSALRQELRRLMLVWHPDKCTHANPKLSCAVFSYIRERWSQVTKNAEIAT